MSIAERLRSRRSVITGAAAAAVGMTAGRLAGASGVRAADGDPLILGATNEAAGFTVLNSTDPGVQALTINVLGGGVALRAESEGGEGVFGASHGPNGNGIVGTNTNGGNGVTGTSDTGVAVSGGTFSGTALLGEVGDGPGLALKALGPVQFSTVVMATIPPGQSTVTVAPVTGKEEQPLDLTEGSTMVVCTLLQNAGPGRSIQFVSIDDVADTFTVHLTAPAKASANVVCFVLDRALF
jgi:hypothetical protein